MKKIFVKFREFVVFGILFVQGFFKNGRGIFREGNVIYFIVIGFVEIRGNVIRVILFEGFYILEVGDNVLGKIVDVKFFSWIVDIGVFYQVSFRVQDVVEERIDLFKIDLRKIFDIGDIIYVKVKVFNEVNQIDLMIKGMFFKGGLFRGGQFVIIILFKVFRFIGKGGLMINMIKILIGMRIIVGQNGWVWVSGKNDEFEWFVIEVIFKVDRESYIQGFIDCVKEFFFSRFREFKEQGVIEEIFEVNGEEGGEDDGQV